jgi:hypothetical protein
MDYLWDEGNAYLLGMKRSKLKMIQDNEIAIWSPGTE